MNSNEARVILQLAYTLEDLLGEIEDAGVGWRGVLLDRIQEARNVLADTKHDREVAERKVRGA